MKIKEQALELLDIDYTDNTPDTGLSPRIYHFNDDQLDAFAALVLEEVVEKVKALDYKNPRRTKNHYRSNVIKAIKTL